MKKKGDFWEQMVGVGTIYLMGRKGQEEEQMRRGEGPSCFLWLSIKDTR